MQMLTFKIYQSLNFKILEDIFDQYFRFVVVQGATTGWLSGIAPRTRIPIGKLRQFPYEMI